jgi:hypothetical protein
VPKIRAPRPDPVRHIGTGDGRGQRGRSRTASQRYLFSAGPADGLDTVWREDHPVEIAHVGVAGPVKTDGSAHDLETVAPEPIINRSGAAQEFKH